MTQIPNTALFTVVLLLPGACAVWAFQRSTPGYGGRLQDWLLRLLGFSALYLVLGSWPLYWVYSNYWDGLAAREPLPWLLFLAPVTYLAVPTAAGWFFGRAVANDKMWATRLVGVDRAPTAWDHLFETGARGFIRCRLRSGRWVGGIYSDNSPAGPKSYSSDDPDRLDLYIGIAFEFDQNSGKPILQDDRYISTGGGLLLKWSDIETLEFQQSTSEKR